MASVGIDLGWRSNSDRRHTAEAIAPAYVIGLAIMPARSIAARREKLSVFPSGSLAFN